MSEHEHSAAMYQRLRRRGETCGECKAATAAAARERRAARKAAPAARAAAPKRNERQSPEGRAAEAVRSPLLDVEEDDVLELEVAPAKTAIDRVMAARREYEAAVDAAGAAMERHAAQQRQEFEHGPEVDVQADGHRVVGAVVARGRMFEDERYTAEDVEYEPIPLDHPAANQESWVGVILPAKQQKRALPWAARR